MSLSVVLISNKPSMLAIAVDYYNRQSIEGVPIELIIVQTGREFQHFNSLKYPMAAKIFRTLPQFDNYYDNAAFARDHGFAEATGDYITFWDDDNIYFPHCLATLYGVSAGNDMGIARVYHTEHIIGDSLEAGRIDTMCVCVKSSIARNHQWYDAGGGFNDFRWINKIANDCDSTRFSPVIIGRHL
jgi:glycosyltransferase involved in cell wall biosynthesis